MKWKLIQAADGEPQIRERDGGPAPRRQSLLAEIARDPASGLSRIADGVYLMRKDLPPAEGKAQGDQSQADDRQ